MCGIAGINTTDNDHHVGNDLLKMLNSIKHRGPNGSGIFVDGKTVHGNLQSLKAPHGSFGMGHNLLSIVGTEVSQPIENHNLVLVANAEIYNFKQIKNCIDDRYTTDSDCEVIISLVKRFYKGSLLNAVINSLDYLDGDYAFAIYDGYNCVVVRDQLGVKPLYYGNDDLRGINAYASERKALWSIGLKNIETLQPDHLLYNGTPLKIENRQTLNLKLSTKCSNINPKTLLTDSARINYQSDIIDKNIINSNDKLQLKNEIKELLIDSVKKRTSGLSRVGIVFSGGVDSTIIAKISDNLGVDTTLYTAGHETSSDINFAKRTASDMGLQLKIKTLEINDVKKYTELVLNAIEEFNIMKLGVGMPSYVASEMAHSDGIKVVMSGQGADEIFAGYHRYIQSYIDNGEKLQEDLVEDVKNLYHVNLQRDDAVTMANSVELRVPYLDPELVEMALKVPIKYKLDNGKENLRKCILREIASDIGVPSEIVRRPKKAAQYGSGIHKILVKKVLKDENYKNKLKALYKI
ncbi:asparagine synthase (glutamine-hydrolyzing) [Methanobacterium sp.]|uniref:asparagine synthase (glutamine-hydrolyzing) n=1 Tax=Methanobacterium sp. TaxID=2164 RepID=UPI003C75FE01